MGGKYSKEMGNRESAAGFILFFHRSSFSSRGFYTLPPSLPFMLFVGANFSYVLLLIRNYKLTSL